MTKKPKLMVVLAAVVLWALAIYLIHELWKNYVRDRNTRIVSVSLLQEDTSGLRPNR